MQAHYSIYKANVEIPIFKKSLTTKETVEKAKLIVESVTGLNFNVYNDTSRKRELVFAKQLLCYLVKNNTNLSLDDVGKIFSFNYYSTTKRTFIIRGYDHSSVIHCCTTISNYLSVNFNSPQKRMIEQALKKWSGF
jgi:chromosomal replication initiation ATPase DnaA